MGLRADGSFGYVFTLGPTLCTCLHGLENSPLVISPRPLGTSAPSKNIATPSNDMGAPSNYIEAKASVFS